MFILFLTSIFLFFLIFISSQIAYPNLEFVQSGFPSDGHKREHRLSVQPKEVSTSTTERPLFRVWNSFLRSVQPNFGFRNLTNPLANLFNNGATNIIETAPVQAETYIADQQADVQQSSTGAAQSIKKRKRKRRKQQKRRPVYESQEQDDSPYDYYGSTLRQRMYYYDPNDYYGMRRLQAFSDFAVQRNYYDQYYKDSSVEDDVPQYTTDKPSIKRYAIVRPLTLAIQLPNTDSSDTSTPDETPDDSVTNENVDGTFAAVGTDTEGNVDSESSTASNDDQMPLSESVRNAFGTYMRDDLESRKRQRQSEQQKEMSVPAKWNPRQQLRYVLAARLVKNH